MTDFNDILDNATQWATEGVTKPSIKEGQIYNINQFTRGIVVKAVTNEDEIIGVIDRRFYDPDSHDAWICDVAAPTRADLLSIIGVIKRICAEYAPTSAENILRWESGDYGLFNNTRFTFNFVVLIHKALIAEW